MSTPTPKTIINNKYGARALFTIESVQDEPAADAPKLLVPQPRQTKFCCRLELPEFSVTSAVFTKKKDAEKAAAKMAVDKLGIELSLPKTPQTAEEKCQALKDRVYTVFADQFLLSYCPFIAHFRAAVQREGDNYGLVPASVISTLDTKIVNLCKSINSRAEMDPALSLALVLNAAKSCSHLLSPADSFWIGKRDSFSFETKEKLLNWSPEFTGKTDNTMEFRERTESCLFTAIFIPCCFEKKAKSLNLKVEPHQYFLDVIANHLSVADSSHVLISRPLSKASLDARFYFPVPDTLPSVSYLFGNSPISEKRKGSPHCQLKYNKRASILVGQEVHGDAILAAVGSSWKSLGTMSCEDISLSSYYRLLLNRVPWGSYKISRDAILAAKLPASFTTRSNWRGALPRVLLINFCHNNRLSDPKFSLSEADSMEKHQNTNQTQPGQSGSLNATGNESGMLDGVKNEMSEGLDDIQCGELDNEPTGRGPYLCAVKILSKAGDLIIECCSEMPYRNKSHAIQSTALKAINVLNKDHERIWPHQDHATFSIVDDMFNYYKKGSPVDDDTSSSAQKLLQKDVDLNHNHEMTDLNITGPDSGKSPSSGTIVCIQYSVFLLGKSVRECLESKEEFEFEFGTGAIIPQLEMCVSRMSVGQSAHFYTSLPPESLILAAAGECAEKISTLPLGESGLEYNVTFLRLMEPPEERMEQAFFSPPLSKQRIEYALRLLEESHAKSWVDLGCGSGSLFDALLEQKTDLVYIAGVDISQRSLIRAAKVLHSKLDVGHKPRLATPSFESAFIYEGSITEFDQRIHGFDVATCIEVIEHMEEDQAYKFGECALGTLCPRILMVSTPNVEYNPILQRNVLDSKNGSAGEDLTEDVEGKSGLPCKFRNYDHKFEWTRKQFSDWALKLASQYGYDVQFSGVGGSGEEPGFASQIAVFKRCDPFHGSWLNSRKCKICSEDYNESNNTDLLYPYKEVWNWKAR